MTESMELMDITTAVLNILYRRVGKPSIMGQIVYVMGFEGQVISLSLLIIWPL